MTETNEKLIRHHIISEESPERHLTEDVMSQSPEIKGKRSELLKMEELISSGIQLPLQIKQKSEMQETQNDEEPQVVLYAWGRN